MPGTAATVAGSFRYGCRPRSAAADSWDARFRTVTVGTTVALVCMTMPDCEERRVLVLTTDPRAGRHAAAALVVAGIAVDWTADLDTAIEAITERSYDVVIVSAVLGPLDGADAIVALRSYRPDLRALLVGDEATAEHE